MRQETINDVSSVIDLNHFIRAAEGSQEKKFDFNNLSNLASDKLRVVGEDKLNDAVDLVLRVAEVNTELMAARASGDCDLGLQFGAPQLLVEKMRRCGATDEQLLNFTSILDLNQMKNIRPAIEAGAVSLQDIVSIRTTDNAEKFREWMRKAGANDANEIVQLYNSATEQLKSKSWPMKITRIISTGGIGVLGGLAASSLGPAAASVVATAAGTIATTVDSFFVDDWINGYNPSLFINELRKLPLNDPHTPDN